MGGCITVIIREENGQTHSLLRHTGRLPSILSNPKLFKKDESWLQSYINEKPYLYENDPDFKQPAAPSSYGIIVIDWQNNKIISANHYCNIGVSYPHLWYEIRDRKVLPTSDPVIKELWEMKKILGLYCPAERESQDINDTATFEEFCLAMAEFSSSKTNRKRLPPFILLDMSPFEVQQFETDPEGFEKARLAILSEGINVDTEAWDKHIKFHFGCEGEE